MNKKPDVLDTFSKVMFFSKWNSPNQTIENKKKREEDVAFIQSELERLAELDRISDLVKDTEPVKALEELKNGLFGHCKSSYLKDDPKELEKILDIYSGFFNIVETALEALEIIKIKPFLLANDYLHLWEIGFIKGTKEEYELLKEIFGK
jgi:hypothetical protein